MRISAVIISLFLLSLSNAYGQRYQITIFPINRTEIDSLINLAEQTNSAERKLEIYHVITRKTSSNNLDTGLYYTDKGLKLAKKVKNKKWQVFFLRYKSACYNHFLHANYARDYIDEAIQIAKENNLKEELGWCYDRLGSNLITYKDYIKDSVFIQEAIYWHKKSAEIFDDLELPEGIGYANSHLSWVYKMIKQYDSALIVAQKALAARINWNKSKQNISKSFNDVGEIYQNSGNYHKAIPNYHQALFLAQEINNQLFIIENQNHLAEIYLALKQYDSARFYASNALDLSIKNNFGWDLMVSAGLLAQLNERDKNFEQALYYNEFIFQKIDSLQNVQDNLDIARKDIEYKYKIEQSNQQQKSQIIEIALGGASVLILGVAFITFYNRKNLNRVNELLLETREKSENQKRSIEQHARELEKINDMKNKLFSIVSHDIKNPLTLTSTYLNLLLSESISQEKFYKILPEINDHLKNTSALLNNLLYWAKGQMSGNMLSKTKFDLSDLLQENIDFVSSHAKNKGLQITGILHPETYVFADKTLIDIVIRNLLTNAIKFCRNGDLIKISTERSPEKIKVIIKDTGVGISLKKLETLFTEQISELGTANEAGWGIGLKLCKEFVEKNGGEIGVESNQGKGAVFYFTIPAYNVQL